MLDGQIKCNFDPKLFGYWKQMGMQFLEQEVKGLVSASGAPRSNAKRKKMMMTRSKWRIWHRSTAHGALNIRTSIVVNQCEKGHSLEAMRLR
jgi:predicted glycosyl hydrolase (DUF1957 family)